MSKKITLNDVKSELFDVIIRLKEGNDPSADPKDTIDIDRAQAIGAIGKVYVEIAKTEVQALNILSRADNPDRTQLKLESSGLLTEKSNQ